MNLIPVILSGGAGTRLWPVSRKSYPKPFMKMADGQSLVEKTLRRACNLDKGSDVLTVTGRDYFFLTRDVYLGMEDADSDRLHYLLEPVGRNTAPAIAMAAHLVRKRWGENTVMMIMPADHLIEQESRFKRAVDAAVALAEDGNLVTFGIEPEHPETGYGYIRKGMQLGFGGYAIEQFVEKPELEIAQHYLESGEYLWNSGMFCFTAKAFLDAVAEHQPTMEQLAQDCFLQTDSDDFVVELDAKTFSKMPGISIDYAVMEKTDHAAVVPGNFGWNDIGSWKAISEIGDSDKLGNMVSGEAIMVDTRNTYIQAGSRLVATVGVENLLVVDSDDALLISDRESSQDVKTVVDQLRQARHTSVEYHNQVQCDWGQIQSIYSCDDHQIRQLSLRADQEITAAEQSGVRHFWLLVSGEGRLSLDQEDIILEENQVLSAAPGARWSLRNTGESELVLIEIQL